MSYLDLYESKSDEVVREGLAGREQVLAKVRATPSFDVAVIGGGIHGAAVARLAAFNGLSTVLCERGDYAGETSSRSSKMVHGGLRYLELLDFRQVLEGVRCREELFRIAGHIAAPHPFMIPVGRGAWFDRVKFALGLTIYDRFLRDRSRRHRWRPLRDLGATPWSGRTDLAGAFEYTDGVMDDARLVLEVIVSARQEGAQCLNYLSVERVGRRESGENRLFCRDVLSGETFDTVAGVVINCAGPWVGQVGLVYGTTNALQGRVALSRGVHILFDRPWTGPAMFLPLAGRGRYYFVWPHPGGTLVGTTEREVAAPESEPVPRRDEIEEIFERLERDLPRAGLERSRAYYAFAGVRTLALRDAAGDTSRLSRRHNWVFGDGMVSLLGGKYTTALSTAEEGLRTAVRLAESRLKVASLTDRRLPGASGATPDEIAAVFAGQAIPPAIREATVRRLGTRVRFLPEFEGWSEVLGGVVLRGEVECALESEQAETLDDLMRRRLGLELMPGHGLAALEAIGAILKARRPARDVAADMARYRARIVALQALLRGEAESAETPRG
jgi:glycerol-3-phosphate dehydrogenase